MAPSLATPWLPAQRVRRWIWRFGGAVLLATLALAAGIVLEEVRLSSEEQRLVRGARDAGRDLAAELTTSMSPASCAGIAAAASRADFVRHARRLLATSPEIAYLHVLNARGDILWSSEQESIATGWRGGAPEEFLGSGWAPSSGRRRTRVTDPSDPQESDVFVEMVTAVAEPPCGAVVLGVSELELAKALRRGIWRTVATLAGFGLTILAVVAAASRALARRQGEQIRRRAHAEHLSELGLLAAGLAHELRNPLNAIRFAADSLAHRARRAQPEKLAGEMEEITQEITDEISGLDRIVTSFLSYARPVPAEPEEVDVATVVRSALTVALPELERAGVAARVVAPPGPLLAYLLPGPLRQVLLNLLINAAQACPPGSSVEVSLVEKGASVLLLVEDDGPGVPAELESSLFEPFSTARREGTGLGLAICRRLVSEMGGSIAYQRREPRGSRFWVELPRRGRGPAA
ncbi:MAG: HAMP domain-containing sensor histidine kinase [Thermoanaerobaculia bacterium]